MRVIDYLNGGGTLESLAADYAIKATRHKTIPNLVSLKYSQIDSPMGDPMVQECRGCVLDEADNWRCVARGFERFFNLGEPNAAKIDWRTARVQEKVDGSLCLLYYYDGVWRVATSGTPDASGDVNGGWPGTYAGLFWRTFDLMDYHTRSCVPGLTYIFELTTPHNRIVVPHSDYKLTLLAIRTSHGNFLRDRFPWDNHFQLVSEFNLASFEDIVKSFATINPLEQEGYVVVDGRGNRVKVKHPQYVALHHMKGSASDKNFLEVIRQGEVPELIAAFPDLAVAFDLLKAGYDALCEQVDSDYEALKGIPVQKDFALEALKCVCSSALFSIRSGRAFNARSYFAECNIDQLMRLLSVEVAA